MSHFFTIFGYEIGLLLLAVLVAKVQAVMIKDNQPIYHGLWAAMWVTCTALTMWPLWEDLHQPPIWAEEMSGRLIPWLYGIAAGCGHLVVFNICLNRFRGLKWTYTSIDTGSILDHLELRLFGSRVWMLELIIGAIWFALQFFFI